MTIKKFGISTILRKKEIDTFIQNPFWINVSISFFKCHIQLFKSDSK